MRELINNAIDWLTDNYIWVAITIAALVVILLISA